MTPTVLIRRHNRARAHLGMPLLSQNEVLRRLGKSSRQPITNRDQAEWWLLLETLRNRVCNVRPNSRRAVYRCALATHEADQYLRLYHPLSEQRWDALRFKALVRMLDRWSTAESKAAA